MFAFRGGYHFCLERMDVRKSGYKDINWFVYKFLPESWKYHSRGKLVFKGPLLDFHDCGRCRLSTSKKRVT